MGQQQVAAERRAERRHQNSAPAEAAGRVHVRRQSAGEENESDDDQTDHSPNDQRQNQEDLVFVVLKRLCVGPRLQMFPN